MRDQPDQPTSSSSAADDPPADEPAPAQEADADVIAPSDAPTPAARRRSHGAEASWGKRGAGFICIVLVAVAGWLALDFSTPSAPRLAETSPALPPADALQTSAPAAPTDRTEPIDARTAAPEPAPRTEAQAPPAEPASPQPPSAARDDDSEPDKPEPIDRYEATVRIEKGDTLESLLRDMEFAPDEIANALRALRPMLRGARLPVGETITLRIQTPPGADAKPILQSLIIRPEARREITVERGGDGGYSAKLRTFDVVMKLMRGNGVVKSSLRASADAAGLSAPVIAELMRAYSWDVNFQYDVKNGDRFAVMVEQPVTTDGRIAGAARVIWAQVTTGAGKNVYSIYRFRPEQGADYFYYGNGQSVVKSFLRTPMDLSRVSSGYGMRNHPILGFTGMHTGVDFAAPYGTPILAAGAGTIAQAGPNGGYGNWVKIDHGGGVSTGYAHMARFAPGVRPGARVRQGQVLGFVGSTGLSTGPHLHYELHRKGKPVNPLNARATQRASLGGKDLERFRSMVARTDRSRDGAELLVTRVSETHRGN